MAVRDPRHLQIFLERVREIVQTREGRRGFEQKRNVTLGELVDFGLAAKTTTGRYVGIGDDRARPSDYFSPPPAAAFTGVTAGFANIFVEWVAPVYTQGGGHAYTEVWAAQYSGTGPLPVFGDATLVSKEIAPIYAYPAGLGVQVHFWLINRTKADVPQTTPTGGVNGQSATTGLIGTTDLGPLIVEAGNLAAGAVDATKFVSTIEPISIVLGALPTTLSTRTIFLASDGKLYRWDGAAYVATVATNDLDGTITSTQIADDAITTPKIFAGAITASKIAANTITAAEIAADTITAGQIAAGAITAGKIAVNAIAVGSAAIQNGAIVNAMIADATIDNAKIASLSVAKLLAGNLQVGSYIYSSSYVPASSGWAINADGTCEFNTGTFRGALGAATGTFAGSLSAATGTFAGSLSAATGSFAGSLSAATGTFAGALSAATGSFSGLLTGSHIASTTFNGTFTGGVLTDNGTAGYALDTAGKVVLDDIVMRQAKGASGVGLLAPHNTGSGVSEVTSSHAVCELTTKGYAVSCGIVGSVDLYLDTTSDRFVVVSVLLKATKGATTVYGPQSDHGIAVAGGESHSPSSSYKTTLPFALSWLFAGSFWVYAATRPPGVSGLPPSPSLQDNTLDSGDWTFGIDVYVATKTPGTNTLVTSIVYTRISVDGWAIEHQGVIPATSGSNPYV